MKKVANKEQEEFKERHGLVAPKAKRRKSVYVEHPAEVISDDDDDRGKIAPSPKKRKISISNDSQSSDGVAPTKQITIEPKSPIKSPTKLNPMQIASNDIDEGNKKKKKKLNSISESSDFNEYEIATSSTVVTNPKKKSKKEKNGKSIEPPGEKPPPSELEYFATFIHTGKPRKARKAYNKLTEEEKQQVSAQYEEKVDAYSTHLRKYLASLFKEDAVAYVSIFRF